MSNKCVGLGCHMRFDKNLKEKRFRRDVCNQTNLWLRNILQSEGVIFEGTEIRYTCNKCYQSYVKRRPPPIEMLTGDDDDVYDGTIEDHSKDMSYSNMLYGVCSHRKCSICLDYYDIGLTPLPKQARLSLLLDHNLFCSVDCRVCIDHLIGNELHPDAEVCNVGRAHVKDVSSKTEEAMDYILTILKSDANTAKPRRLDFSDMSDENCKAWTGWTLSEFQAIHDLCSSSLTHLSSLSSENAMLLFWAKLKSNISWPQLSSLIGVSKSSVSRIFHTVTSVLHKIVMPRFLGSAHISREVAKTHNTIFTRLFYGNKVTIILDGTYIYIQKSNEHQLQRSSYSGQKKRNLVKFMSVVFPDGYVLDTIGPFYGTDNDAKITKKIIDTISDLRTWLNEEDIFIVDRGFRDVLELLESSGFESHMPSYLKQGQTQHEGIEANNDRRCTKTRWVVESYHGRLKQWRMFKEQLSSNFFLNVIGELVQITTSCLNGFRGPIYVPNPQRDERDTILAARMQSRITLKSNLATRVKEDPELTKRSKALWQKLDAIDIDFPQLDLEYLETVACGTYQIKQAPGYISEHLTDEGDYEMWAYRHSKDIIRVQIRSRHKSQTKYNVWIQFEDSDDPIKDYYCQCPTGTRTIGMCAHTASILYYLGYVSYHLVNKPVLPHAKKFKLSMHA